MINPLWHFSLTVSQQISCCGCLLLKEVQRKLVIQNHYPAKRWKRNPWTGVQKPMESRWHFVGSPIILAFMMSEKDHAFSPKVIKLSSVIYFSVCGLAGVSLEERPLGECLGKPVLQESFSHISKRQLYLLITHKCLSPTKISHMNFKDRDPTSSQIFLRRCYRHFKLNMLKTESHFSLHHQKQRQNIALLHDSHSIRDLCVILEDSTLISILI